MVWLRVLLSEPRSASFPTSHFQEAHVEHRRPGSTPCLSVSTGVTGAFWGAWLSDPPPQRKHPSVLEGHFQPMGSAGLCAPGVAASLRAPGASSLREITKALCTGPFSGTERKPVLTRVGRSGPTCAGFPGPSACSAELAETSSGAPRDVGGPGRGPGWGAVREGRSVSPLAEAQDAELVLLPANRPRIPPCAPASAVLDAGALPLRQQDRHRVWPCGAPDPRRRLARK